MISGRWAVWQLAVQLQPGLTFNDYMPMSLGPAARLHTKGSRRCAPWPLPQDPSPFEPAAREVRSEGVQGVRLGGRRGEGWQVEPKAVGVALPPY